MHNIHGALLLPLTLHAATAKIHPGPKTADVRHVSGYQLYDVPSVLLALGVRSMPKLGSDLQRSRCVLPILFCTGIWLNNQCRVTCTITATHGERSMGKRR